MQIQDLGTEEVVEWVQFMPKVIEVVGVGISYLGSTL